MAPLGSVEIGLNEVLPDQVPAALVGSRFEDSYKRDLRYHKAHCVFKPEPGVFLNGLAANADALADRPSVFFFGGGKVPDADFFHACAVSAYVATMLERLQSVTGSGPGVMAAAHIGPTQSINGAARNIGLTLPGLVTKEPPGEHNHELLTVCNMARRLELFFRLCHAGFIFPGGIGTLEEFFAVTAVLVSDRNQEINYPFILSEPQTGDDTYMQNLLRFLEGTLGKARVNSLFILQQDSDWTSLNVLNQFGSNPHGYWNGDIYLPPSVFTPFALNPEDVATIDLSDSQDDPERFLAHLRWFTNLLVQLVMIDKGGSYLRIHGKPQIRISGVTLKLLQALLERVWSEHRVKTERGLLDLIQWDVKN